MLVLFCFQMQAAIEEKEVMEISKLDKIIEKLSGECAATELSARSEHDII